MSENKENTCLGVRKGKFVELKNNVERKKGLSLNAETRATTTHASMQKSFGSAKFSVHSDNEQDCSGSRPRKHVSRKEIREKRTRNSEATAITSTLLTAETLEIKKNAAVVRGPYRSRSSANWNRYLGFLDDKNKMKNFPRRAYSETRRIPSTHLIVTPKTKNQEQKSTPKTKSSLTDDVKKRTLASIERWKKKMRKRSDIVPSYANKHSNVLNIDRGNKTKLQDNIITDICKIQKCSATSSNALNVEVLQRQTINSQKNIQKLMPAVDFLTTRYSSNEVTTNVQDDSFSSIQEDINKTSATSPINSVAGQLAEIKCKKCMMEDDYLEDTPDVERMREEISPSLSSRFLRGSVNAQQRRIIVRYLIHLAIRCNYSSHIIYQTVKLFDLAIDRILVNMNNIQLMSLACLWITLKREIIGHQIPSATAILRLAKDMYINQEKNLLMYEKKILLTLKFSIRFADPYSVLFYYIKSVKKYVINSNDIPHIYFCGSYLIDLSMLDESLCDILESIRALAAVNLSLNSIYLNNVNVAQAYREFQKSRNLTEWEERELKSVKKSVLSQILDSENENSDLYIVYKKYVNCQHINISNFFLNKVKKLLQQEMQHKF
nr:PREDICTED: uncharacterized protein LOC105672131 isoform X1 [Linepithema humile]